MMAHGRNEDIDLFEKRQCGEKQQEERQEKPNWQLNSRMRKVNHPIAVESIMKLIHWATLIFQVMTATYHILGFYLKQIQTLLIAVTMLHFLNYF